MLQGRYLALTACRVRYSDVIPLRTGDEVDARLIRLTASPDTECRQSVNDRSLVGTCRLHRICA